MKRACASHSTTFKDFLVVQISSVGPHPETQRLETISVQRQVNKDSVPFIQCFGFIPQFQIFSLSEADKTSQETRNNTPGRKQEVGMTCIIDNKTCMLAKHSGCIPLHVPLLPTPSIPHFIFWPLMGGSLHWGRERKINSSRSNPRAWSITHSSQQWAWCRAAARGGKSKEANTPRLRGEIAVGRPAPHWVIAHLSPAWNVRGNSCPSSKIQSAECSSGRLMDVSTGRAL